MFQTHDNKLNEHEISIIECFDHLKEVEDRLVVVEKSHKGGDASSSSSSSEITGLGAAEAASESDINDLISNEHFINGVVDNIMSTTNFSSIVNTIVPLTEDSESLKLRIAEQERRHDQMCQFIEQLEQRLKYIENEWTNTCSSAATAAASEIAAAVVDAAVDATVDATVDAAVDAAVDSADADVTNGSEV